MRFSMSFAQKSTHNVSSHASSRKSSRKSSRMSSVVSAVMMGAILLALPAATGCISLNANVSQKMDNPQRQFVADSTQGCAGLANTLGWVSVAGAGVAGAGAVALGVLAFTGDAATKDIFLLSAGGLAATTTGLAGVAGMEFNNANVYKLRAKEIATGNNVRGCE